MRVIKLSYLAMIVIAWWLTISGHLGVPVRASWVVALIGLTAGFLFGCVESRHTYHANYLTGIQKFVADAELIMFVSFLVTLWRLEQIGLAMAWLPVTLTASFAYFANPSRE